MLYSKYDSEKVIPNFQKDVQGINEESNPIKDMR